MNNRKIQGIVYDFLQGNATSELVPCIFHVTIVAASAVEPKQTISENDHRNMISLLSFVLRLQNELNSPTKISYELVKQDLEMIQKELESVLYNTLLFLPENESFEVIKAIRQFVAQYDSLTQFIHEKIEKA